MSIETLRAACAARRSTTGIDAAQLLVDRHGQRRRGAWTRRRRRGSPRPRRELAGRGRSRRRASNHSPPSENESGVTLTMPMSSKGRVTPADPNVPAHGERWAAESWRSGRAARWPRSLTAGGRDHLDRPRRRPPAPARAGRPDRAVVGQLGDRARRRGRPASLHSRARDRPPHRLGHVRDRPALRGRGPAPRPSSRRPRPPRRRIGAASAGRRPARPARRAATAVSAAATRRPARASAARAAARPSPAGRPGCGRRGATTPHRALATRTCSRAAGQRGGRSVARSRCW